MADVRRIVATLAFLEDSDHTLRVLREARETLAARGATSDSTHGGMRQSCPHLPSAVLGTPERYVGCAVMETARQPTACGCVVVSAAEVSNCLGERCRASGSEGAWRRGAHSVPFRSRRSTSSV